MDPSFLFRHRSPSRDEKSLFRFLARRNTKDYQAANTLVPSGSLARLRRGDEWPPRDKAARDEVVFRQLGQVFFDRSPLRKNRRYVAFLARLGPGLLSRPIIGVFLLPHANQFTSAIERSVLVSWPFAARPSSAMLFAHYLSPRWIERFNCSSASVSLAVISLISRKGYEDSKGSLSG